MLKGLRKEHVYTMIIIVLLQVEIAKCNLNFFLLKIHCFSVTEKLESQGNLRPGRPELIAAHAKLMKTLKMSIFVVLYGNL